MIMEMVVSVEPANYLNCYTCQTGQHAGPAKDTTRRIDIVH